MKLKMQYHLIGGQMVEQETSEFLSVDAARDKLAPMFAQPSAVASLNHPGGCDMVNVAAIACISITPAAGD